MAAFMSESSYLASAVSLPTLPYYTVQGKHRVIMKGKKSENRYKTYHSVYHTEGRTCRYNQQLHLSQPKTPEMDTVLILIRAAPFIKRQT